MVPQPFLTQRFPIYGRWPCSLAKGAADAPGPSPRFLCFVNGSQSHRNRSCAWQMRSYDRQVGGFRLLPLVVALLTCADTATGKCPVPGRPCESLLKADLVFYGEVVAAGALQHGDQRVTFLVVRSFKGAREGRFTGAFRVTGEGLYFVAGERRVVYASALGNGRWSTSCARSAVVLRPADAEVEELTKCNRQESRPVNAQRASCRPIAVAIRSTP